MHYWLLLVTDRLLFYTAVYWKRDN